MGVNHIDVTWDQYIADLKAMEMCIRDRVNDVYRFIVKMY